MISELSIEIQSEGTSWKPSFAASSVDIHSPDGTAK